MNSIVFFVAGKTLACRHASEYLSRMGYCVYTEPSWNTTDLLLDVPSFREGPVMDTLLSSLPGQIRIWGGNLNHPVLDGFTKQDLLEDEKYLAENAAITADCTLKILGPRLCTTWRDTNTLIIGWGRIGKCLGQMLKSLGCPVTIAVRKTAQQAALSSLGYDCADSNQLKEHLSRFNLIINTVPEIVVSEEDVSLCPHTLKVDLASRKGIAGEDVLWARGLPGIHAPISSGTLIARTIIRRLEEIA